MRDASYNSRIEDIAKLDTSSSSFPELMEKRRTYAESKNNLGLISIGYEFLSRNNYRNAVQTFKEVKAYTNSEKSLLLEGLYTAAKQVIAKSKEQHQKDKDIKTQKSRQKNNDAYEITINLPVAKDALFMIVDISGRTKEARKYLNELANEYITEHQIRVKQTSGNFSDIELLTGALDTYEKAHNIPGMVKVSTLMLYHYDVPSAAKGYLSSFNTMIKSSGINNLDNVVHKEFKPHKVSKYANNPIY